jgi:hypothetical protein
MSLGPKCSRIKNASNHPWRYLVEEGDIGQVRNRLESERVPVTQKISYAMKRTSLNWF